MRTILILVLAVVVVGLIAAFGSWGWESYLEHEAAEAEQERRVAAEDRFRAIIAEADALVAQCPFQETPPILRGKAYIWDSLSRQQHAALMRLPKTMRGGADDKQLTFFLVVGRREKQVKEYGWPNRPKGFEWAGPASAGVYGYRRDSEVCVIYWPDKQPVGKFVVHGDEPPAEVEYPKDNVKRVYGDSVVALARWVATLPLTEEEARSRLGAGK